MISRIGIGGYGAVYLAEREADRRRVAIKVMLSHIVVSEEARKKFAKEIEILKGLSHDHIVSVEGSGSAGSAFYFVMEHCAGGSVADYVSTRGGRLSASDAFPIMLQSLKGLAYAHDKSIVHRDLKPSNIPLTGKPDKPIAKIADMGLAKNFERAGFSGMTVTGAYAGTPYFMPKEQLLNYKYVKPVTDVWSTGATFYYMLAGVTPREYPKGADPVEVILQNEMIPIQRRNPKIPNALATVLDKATHANKDERYENAGEIDPQVHGIQLKDGDIVCLCTDGLWGMVPNSRIQSLLSGGGDAVELCRNLINAGKDAGGYDNLTAVVLRIEPSQNGM